GRDPHHHGVRADASAAGDRARDALPARFAKEGWATALVSDAGGRALHDVDLGFARSLAPDPRDDAKRAALAKQTPILPFLDSHLGRDLFPAMRGFAEACDPDWVADDAIRALGRDRDRPLFLTVMTSAASAPYGARAPWYARFTRKAYRGRFKYDAPAASGGERADDEDVAQERALYDGAVASEDAAIGRVLAAIDRRGMRDRTIVAVVSEHGELLHED